MNMVNLGHLIIFAKLVYAKLYPDWKCFESFYSFAYLLYILKMPIHLCLTYKNIEINYIVLES